MRHGFKDWVVGTMLSQHQQHFCVFFDHQYLANCLTVQSWGFGDIKCKIPIDETKFSQPRLIIKFRKVQIVAPKLSIHQGGFMSTRQGQQRLTDPRLTLCCAAGPGDKRHQHHAGRGVPQAGKEREHECSVWTATSRPILWSAATTWIWASFYAWINFANIFYRVDILAAHWTVLTRFVILLEGNFHSIFPL